MIWFARVVPGFLSAFAPVRQAKHALACMPSVRPASNHLLQWNAAKSAVERAAEEQQAGEKEAEAPGIETNVTLEEVAWVPSLATGTVECCCRPS